MRSASNNDSRSVVSDSAILSGMRDWRTIDLVASIHLHSMRDVLCNHTKTLNQKFLKFKLLIMVTFFNYLAPDNNRVDNDGGFLKSVMYNVLTIRLHVH